MNINDTSNNTLIEPPRRLTRKQCRKWVGCKETPKYLRHIGGGYVSLREAAPEASVSPSNSKTRH